MHEARIGKIRNVYRILVRQSGGNAYCRCRLEDNIRISVLYIYHCWGLSLKFNFLCLEKPLIRMYINPYNLCFPKHKVSNLVTG